MCVCYVDIRMPEYFASNNKFAIDVSYTIVHGKKRKNEKEISTGQKCRTATAR